MVESARHDSDLPFAVRTKLSLPLTDMQYCIVRQAPTKRLLVTAGPGTGKTHVLIARLEALVRHYELSPGSQVLVLSFSRAAVREVRDRLKTVGGDVGFVRAYTFDSFATRLLSRFEPEGSWPTLDYDDRIDAAIELLNSNEKACEFLADYLHILVDEIQDLVGVRADFVLKILRSADKGFTLLGDPAQGIYNFAVEGSARTVGSQALYRKLRSEYGESLEEFELYENHRIETKSAEMFLWAGAKLSRPECDYKKTAGKILDGIEDLPSLGTIQKTARALQKEGGTTAVLTRNNGQALVISRKLSAADISHVLRQAATERLIAPWVGWILGRFPHILVARRQFLAMARDARSDSEPDPEEMWDLLKRTERRPGRMLDLSVISRVISQGYVPDELSEILTDGLTVSTVHRAKGLEFDKVVLVRPINLLESDWLGEEVRVLFVALTRARTQIYRVDSPKVYGLKRWPPNGERRWVRRYGYQTESVEVRGSDSEDRYPAGTYGFEDDAVDLQRYLSQHVKPGDAVLLKRLGSVSNHTPRILYGILHNDRQIGVTSEGFSYGLYAALKLNPGWKVQTPGEIRDLRVQAVDTVAGQSAVAAGAGLNESGIWLRVRVAGLGRTRGEWSYV